MKTSPYPEYKTTRSHWVGSAPSHWKFLRADFTTQSNKEQVSDSAMEGLEVLHYSIPNVQEYGTAQVEAGSEIDSAKLRITRAQLLISKLNPRKATICIATPDPKLLTVCSGEFVPIIPEGELDLKYCYYTWLSDKATKLFSSRVQSVTRSHQRVEPTEITKLAWAWPPTEEQQKIAAFLDWKTQQIDTLIERKRTLLEKLKEKRSAVITLAVTRGLNPSAPMCDSGIAWLGKVPKHWRVMRLRRFIESIEQGWSPECHNVPAADEEWGIVKAGCCNGGCFNPNENKSLPDSLNPIENLEIKGGDLLMSRASGSEELIGSVALVPDGIRRRLILSDKTYRLTCEHTAADPAYVAHALQSPLGRTQIKAIISGAFGLARNIAQGDVKNLIVPLPPLNEQRTIIDFLNQQIRATDTLSSRVNEAIARLTEYRIALITAATTGKIDVRNVKIPAAA